MMSKHEFSVVIISRLAYVQIHLSFADLEFVSNCDWPEVDESS